MNSGLMSGLSLEGDRAMKHIHWIAAALSASTAALAYEPAEERDFGEFAASGCRNRDGDFIVRGMVSSANEDTMVLSDPLDSRSTASVTLPGRGPLARVRGVFGTSKHEASDETLNELRMSRTPVVVLLKCRREGTPTALEISYRNADGSRAAISY
jgi:hypothetical protein